MRYRTQVWCAYLLGNQSSACNPRDYIAGGDQDLLMERLALLDCCARLELRESVMSAAQG